MLTRLFVFTMWLLHWLPLPILAAIGRGLGRLLYWVAAARRRIVRTNLRLCFPELDEAGREALVKEHFALFGRTTLEHGLSWWASEERLRRLIRVEGAENFVEGEYRRTDRPFILVAPHFLGLDIGGTAMSMLFDFVSVYAHQKNAVIDHFLYKGRKRFGDQFLLSRQDGIRATVRALREHRPFYYLPDMDYGARDAVFVPFFGVQAATITGVSRLAKLTGASVHACITEILPGGKGYVTRVTPAWENYPTDDPVADTARMNAFIEAEIRRIPAQYYWVHRRFKTRPPGEKSVY